MRKEHLGMTTEQRDALDAVIKSAALLSAALLRAAALKVDVWIVTPQGPDRDPAGRTTFSVFWTPHEDPEPPA